MLRDINYKNGEYEGSYKEYNNNGSLIAETSYKNDLIEGKYLNYYDNGNIHYSYSMHQGNYVGDYKEYNKDGTIRKHQYFEKDGKKTNKGKWTIYYDTKWNEVGNPSEFYRIIDFTNNSNNNTIKVKDYYNNGSVQMEGTYSSIDTDIKDGVFKWFSKEGIVTMKGNYINGVKEGVWETYYDKKNVIGSLLKERVKFTNGLMQGKYLYFGTKLVNYKPQTDYGYWKLEGNLRNGKLDGTWKIWLLWREKFCWYKIDVFSTSKFNNGNEIEKSYLNLQSNKVYDKDGNIFTSFWGNYAKSIVKTNNPFFCREPGYY